MYVTSDGDVFPETIEEWIEIHGEPPLEEMEVSTGDLDRPFIKVLNCEGITYEQTEGHKSIEQCIYTTDKGSKRINYPNSAKTIAEGNNLICVQHMLYTPDGYMSDMSMRKEISESLISAGWTDVLDSPTTHILNTVKDLYNEDKLPVDSCVIPFRNGDLHLGKGWQGVEGNGGYWEFRRGEKKQTAYRLAVDYVDKDTPMPWFNKWVNDTFVEEDVRTLQEILGYCLLPITAAQEAFILVGEAGVGKSVLTRLLSEIFGNAYQELSIKELAENRFYTSLVENKLVVYDDDLHTEAISETGIFKKLITANQEITAERKFEQPHKFLPYCTIIANSNDMIKTLYDDSDGFYRRLHPLHVKDKELGRKNIANMAELVCSEKEAICRWALTGLVRVIRRKFRISWSKRSLDYMASEKSKNMHFPEFMSSVFEFGCEGEVVTTEQICKLYKSWCKSNACSEVSLRRLQNWIRNNAEKLKIERKLIGEKRLAGYAGLKIRSEWSQNIVI